MNSKLPVVALRDAVHFPGHISTLHVMRDRSLRALKAAERADGRVVVLSQRDMSASEPAGKDLFDVGIISELLHQVPLPDGGMRIALRGLQRVCVKGIDLHQGFLIGAVELVLEPAPTGDLSLESEAMRRAVIASFSRLAELQMEIPPEAVSTVVSLGAGGASAGILADAVMHHLTISPSEKQSILELFDPEKRLEATHHLLRHELQVLEVKDRIHEKVDRELGHDQRRYYLREQLKVIQEELRASGEMLGESAELEKRIKEAGMSPRAHQKALDELRRLEHASPNSQEAMVIRSYIDTLMALPWAITTPDQANVSKAKTLLDERHFGLPRVKERILDHLAVRQLRNEPMGSVMCFVGPPGVGKTSVARSIAKAMGRRFFRLSLGGVTDNAEIRGHRRAYVGSAPGRILQGLIDTGSRNPVILLDEIDKLVQGSHAEAVHALLEALDPEQNGRFGDHYLEVPFDLSQVVFIATANLIDTIPSALADRMEIINFEGYTQEERTEIGRRFLWPKALAMAGLAEDPIPLSDEGLALLVTHYAREAGVRELTRQLETLARKAARRRAEGASMPSVLDEAVIVEWLGRPRAARSAAYQNAPSGVAWALVVSSLGGDVVPVEAVLQPRAGTSSAVRLTGSLGEVMRESATTAITLLSQREPSVAVADVHVHVPEGATPKDGPSAGLTIFLALASAASGVPLKPKVAITGELTLVGRILAVGGIRDKVLAAIANSFEEVIVPADNESDLEDLPESARNQIKIHLVRTADEALQIVQNPRSELQ